ncbi:MAG: helix-turn-helix domain-containing protein [bacterium]
MKMESEDYLAHYGILRRSGRYPWGSGGNVEARSRDFLGYVAGLKKQGLSDVEIARGVGMTTSQLRDTRTIARNAKKQADYSMIRRLREKGMSPTAIGERMNRNESSIRALIKEMEQEKQDVLMTTANMLRDEVEKKGAIDIGSGTENHIGISDTKMRSAVAILKDEGYKVHQVKVQQQYGGKQTTRRVLAKDEPDYSWSSLKYNPDRIQLVRQISIDGGHSFQPQQPPTSVSSKRIRIRYKEDGGDQADGVMYLRPGAPDLSLGGKTYAQVRVAVDGTHYLKGMAMYRDDLPSGVDILFNTNKSRSDAPTVLDALKKLNRTPEGDIDWENPFGAVTKPLQDRDGKVISAMNIINEEGDWDRWSRTLSSQTLSKQSPRLAKIQLDKKYDQHKREYDEIMELTNPVVKRKLLMTFSGQADNSAEHMKAAALPKSSWHVLLPFNSMKENEIYAPNYDNGEVVALIRYPHGGTFEIPELVVNNNHRAAKKALGQAPDAVGINAAVAKRLSGADFDGDAVLVIPNKSGNIKTTAPLHQLKDFDPQREYPKYEGMKVMTPQQKGKEMGRVSNLITDMTIKGAGPDDIARAVKHSMVVIDAEKHELNWKLSEQENGIPALMKKYQNKETGGAATIISRARARKEVPARREARVDEGGPIDPRTGKKVYVNTGATKRVKKVNKETGEVTYVEAPRTTRSIRIRETDDAHTLTSKPGYKIEKVYADHSNRLKALANEARKQALATKPRPYSPEAKKAYASEVASLDAKIHIAKLNRPLERQAQSLASAEYSAKRRADPNMTSDQEKKVRSQALAKARARTGAKKSPIDITPDEWRAIQAGAISTNKLSTILDNADLDQVKKYATPKAAVLMSPSKTSRAQALLRTGATQAEVAAQLGVSLTTLKRALAEG